MMPGIGSAYGLRFGFLHHDKTSPHVHLQVASRQSFVTKYISRLNALEDVRLDVYLGFNKAQQVPAELQQLWEVSNQMCT